MGAYAKPKATVMIESLIEKYSYLEKSDHLTNMAYNLFMWNNLHKNGGAKIALMDISHICNISANNIVLPFAKPLIRVTIIITTFKRIIV